MKNKKKFIKPILKKVPLVADETVLAGCKVSTGNGAGPGGAMGKCLNDLGMGQSSPCNAAGS